MAAILRESFGEFGVSRKTDHKMEWLKRYQDSGSSELTELSRSPKNSPQRTGQVVERFYGLTNRTRLAKYHHGKNASSDSRSFV